MFGPGLCFLGLHVDKVGTGFSDPGGSATNVELMVHGGLEIPCRQDWLLPSERTQSKS